MGTAGSYNLWCLVGQWLDYIHRWFSDYWRCGSGRSSSRSDCVQALVQRKVALTEEIIPLKVPAWRCTVATGACDTSVCLWIMLPIVKACGVHCCWPSDFKCSVFCCTKCIWNQQ